MNSASVKHKVLSFIESEHLFSYESKLIVAVSGGADSVTLLRVLVDSGYDCVAAHCNFHLRNDESDRDQHFVESLCAELSVPLELVHFNTAEFAREKKISIEMAARELRYNWFEKIRVKHAADVIAVAHHADDVVETFLMNVVRGTGIHGLTGIKPVSGRVVRPLLCLYRDEIENFLKTSSFAYVTDSTNLQQEYQRNKFRLSVIPLILSVNPSAKSNILNDIKHLRDVELLYDSHVSDLRSSIVKDCVDGAMTVDLQNLLLSPAPSTLLFEFLSPFDFTFTQCDDMVGAARDNNVGRTWHSSSHISYLDRGVFTVRQIADSENHDVSISEEDISNLVNIGGLSFALIDSKDVAFSKGNNVAFLDYQKLQFPLVLRKWKSGDFLFPFGMKGRKKKVSDLLIDSKVPISQKSSVRVITDASGALLWVVGIRSDERFSLTEQSTRVLKMSCSSR